MHVRAALAFVALTLVFAGAASAQNQNKPGRPSLPPRPPVEAPAAPVQSMALPALAAPQRLTGLVGMRPIGDPGPACRAQCSKDRYICHAAGDAIDCDSRWVPCLRACAAP